MAHYNHKNYTINRDDSNGIITTKPTLWHCNGSRSLRVLWLLEELQADFDLVLLHFPPRFAEDNYEEINPLGTVPYFVDGNQRMTESTAICHYLATQITGGERYLIEPNHPHYADFLNWLYMSDSTLTMPQTVMLRYSVLEPPKGRLPQVVEQYKETYLARLTRLDDFLSNSKADYLCDNRFTIADIAVGYAVLLGAHPWINISDNYSPTVLAYLERLKQRPAYMRASSVDIA